ncbi:glutamine synthetase family protein [Dasania sp. GY-MA-18]|uniref:Glutamine synthetase family protein n=1 Tax=Dasania phycosphaerae TaxID=2950436 RepID=A0A9J6RLK0_9GAMM|nr:MULTISPECIES: glutamine synthetase family protein [Dasania]MCR8923166.1 glutamine synthetase family protein [Dasania sp. GY-MA-18]MCZ0865598.1 glutamine synthetase family protein [Dasania phycosphaerae]MCZ0869323.1 glutamine synthetase family protein [Dasania phycosphaerae]
MSKTANPELEAFLENNPEIQMLEVLIPDMNGILRTKRIPRLEFATFFKGNLKAVTTMPLVNTMGDYNTDIGKEYLSGDPDKSMKAIPNTLATVPWLKSPTGQVMASITNLDGTPGMYDPRNILEKLLQDRFYAKGLKPIVATEMEFYLLEQSDDAKPRVKLGRIHGTGLKQQGVQYAMADELWENDEFLNDVRLACELQGVPMTTIHSEFSPGQLEINVHHVEDPLVACDHAVLLKRIIKGVALQHGMAACFMAKPYAELAGNGMHMHVSVYDKDGNNIFVEPGSEQVPPLNDTMRHAIGGLADTMSDCMAVFAPNANSYRRLVPGAYAPVSTAWGYNHRDVSLRIPTSGSKDLRIEHRVAGADTNPYLAMACVLMGIDYGMENKCQPHGEMVQGGEFLGEMDVDIPITWEAALDAFDASTIVKGYLGEEYCGLFSQIRRDECDAFRAIVSNVDYEWYLRAV